MNDNRFNNVLGDEYDLFKLSVPHHDELQDLLGAEVKKYCENLQKEKIIAIDGGVGTGLTAIRILSADPRVVLTAIDNEEKTLRVARMSLHSFAGRVSFLKDDLLDALQKIDDTSIDIFASAFVLHNFTPAYRTQVFLELARILKPGGLFINGDKYAREDLKQHKQDLAEQIKAFDIYDIINRSDLKKEWTKHYLEDEQVKITEGGQIALLESVGFRNPHSIFRKRMEAIIVAAR